VVRRQRVRSSWQGQHCSQLVGNEATRLLTVALVEVCPH